MTWEWAVVLVVFQACLAYALVKVHDRERDHHDSMVESASRAMKNVEFAKGIEAAQEQHRTTEMRRQEWFVEAMRRLDKVERDLAAAQTKAALR